MITGLASRIDVEQVLETGTVPLGLSLEAVATTLLVYVLINGYTLWYFGQSLGKRMMKIAIVTEGNRVPGFTSLVAVRYAPFQFAAQIAGLYLISLVDILMIFRNDRRCLHDLLAKTRVIDVSTASTEA